MANYLRRMLESNETYLVGEVSRRNREKAFPYNSKIDSVQLIRDLSNDSVMISGGTDRERSTFIIGMLKKINGPVILLHNGNDYLSPDRIRKYGIDAAVWDGNIYLGLPKSQIIAALNSNGADDGISSFYAYAFEVCEVLGIPGTIQNIAKIDWLGTNWQRDLLMNMENRDHALDLLRRFDSEMAKMASIVVSRTERLARTPGDEGMALNDALSKSKVLVKCVYGSKSATARQCFELIEKAAEEGRRFTLILDDVYVKDNAIIEDNFRNVRLILAGDDLTQYEQRMKITNRSCSFVAFNHSEYESCELISGNFFGKYEKKNVDIGVGYGKVFLENRMQNKNIHISQVRDYRLRPELIAELPIGCAYVHLKNGTEGMVNMAS